MHSSITLSHANCKTSLTTSYSLRNLKIEKSKYRILFGIGTSQNVPYIMKDILYVLNTFLIDIVLYLLRIYISGMSRIFTTKWEKYCLNNLARELTTCLRMIVVGRIRKGKNNRSSIENTVTLWIHWLCQISQIFWNKTREGF